MTDKKTAARTTTAKRSRPRSKDAAAGNGRKSPGGDTGMTEPDTHGGGCPVVGVGASAGGLDAYKRFLSAMPPDSPLALVLIPHLDPTHESLMAELLGRHTQMPVCEAQQDMAIEPGGVYIIPPNRYMTISGGRLRLATPEVPRGMQTALDTFLRSLADDQGSRAIGIILSGTGSHGVAGLKEIKLAGGMFMAQQPETAEYDQMPRSAIATGLVDFVLPPEEMPATLLKYVQHPYVRATGKKAPARQTQAAELNRILAVLRTRTKYDFRAYRKNMLLRRVQRRMGLRQMESLDDYVELLRGEPKEVTALYNDLLIGVTSFFREPAAFQVLAQRVFPDLVAGVEADAMLRVWVPGCSTGEEAYTIAILLIEAFKAADRLANIQIFATDIDEHALDTGRQGIYPDSISADLTPERLQRFFVQAGDHAYQVNKQLRDSVVFAPQSLISDAPFSRLDLVSCRNLLIYLEAPIQQKVISLFHFALRENGYLLLGPSESIGQHTELFETVSKKWRVFRRIGPSRRDLVDIPIVASSERPLYLPRAGAGVQPHIRFAELTEKRLLDAYAPAAVLIDRKYQVLYFHGPTVNYLEFPTGEPSRDLMAITRQGLRTKVRAALHKALHSNEEVLETDARVKRNGDYAHCRISVMPLQEPQEARGLLLVTFVDTAEPAIAAPTVEGTGESHLISQLEQELKVARVDLQATIEEMESSNEELKASNEEVMSMNEELQSANEELETSKEELQSLNEELSTVNSQLSDKVDELEQANNDMVNLFHSTDIATLFLDADLRIKRFTPATARLLNLIAGDIGRPVSNFAPNFSDKSLFEDVKEVMDKLNRVEKEIHSADGRHYLRRVLPYRTAENRIEGVIVTFIDITERIQHEAAVLKLNGTLEERVKQQTHRLWEEEQHTRTILDTTPDAIVTINAQGVIESCNPGTEQLFGYSVDEAVGRDVTILMPGYLAKKHQQYIDNYLATGEKHIAGSIREVLARKKDGSLFPVEISISEIDHTHRFTGIIRDISERKMLQRAVLEMADEEQRLLGQEMHDGTQQELAGLDMLAGGLAKDLAAENPDLAARAQRLSEGLRDAQDNVRRIARNLIPIEIESHGLGDALRALANRVKTDSRVACRAEVAKAVKLDDPHVATHLYRIAQEAVNNALRHSGAGEIVISLRKDDDHLFMAVRDNGTGLPPELRTATGVGLRIMSYRAGLIGARLDITNRDAGGAQVACTYPAQGGQAIG